MGCSPSQRLQLLKIVLPTVRSNMEIKEDDVLQRQACKLLLLGNSDSGKSTLVKQMKILHTGGFMDFELKNYRYLIFGNIFEAVQSLVKGAAFLDITLDDECQKKVSLFCEMAVDGQILELASEIWKSPQIQECFAEKHRLAALSENANAEYFLSNLNRIAANNYIPNDVDILYCRNHTSGVYCTDFKQSEKLIRLIDVGGQNSERRKWIHCFDDVTAILFVAALSGYDQMLEEKTTANRMFDALALFDEICKSDYFLQTSIVLFLNKKDVFEEKIKKVPLTVCFRDYSGENDLKTASAYISNQFIKNKGRDIYRHFTNATDTQNIDIVFSAVINTVIRINIESTGFE